VPIPWKTAKGAVVVGKANQVTWDKDINIHKEDAVAKTNAERGTQDKDAAYEEHVETEIKANRSKIEE